VGTVWVRGVVNARPKEESNVGQIDPREREELESRLRGLEERLDKFSDAVPLTDTCLGLLQKAYADLAADRFPECRTSVLRVKCLLDRAVRSAATVKRWGIWIGLYVALSFYAVLAVASRGRLLLGHEVIQYPWPGWLPPAGYFVWAAAGSAAAALYGLVLHASRRDLDEAYLTWYWVKPWTGMAFGPLIYYFARAGMMATQHNAPKIVEPALLYLGAFVVAFSERLSMRLVDRLCSAILGPAEAPTADATVPAKP
jgi:hypothetical protein